MRQGCWLTFNYPTIFYGFYRLCYWIDRPAKTLPLLYFNAAIKSLEILDNLSYASCRSRLWKSGRLIYHLSGHARTMCLAYIKQGWNMQLFIESSPITALLQMLAILISSNWCTWHAGTPVNNWMGSVLSCFAFRIECLDFNSKKLVQRVPAKAFSCQKKK